MIKIKSQQVLIFCLLIAYLGMVSSCSKEVSFQKSTVVPAAKVKVKVDRDNNDNYEVDVEVKDLAQPQDLTPERNSYVVWIESKQGAFNIGQLQVSDKLKGSLVGYTPYKPTKIKITAEDNPRATQPGNQVVLISEDINIK